MFRCTLILILFSFTCNAQDILDRATYPKVAKAIKNHESAFEKSTLSKKHNNLFGFKSSSNRVIGKTSSGYSIYSTKDCSKKDYLDFEQRMIKKYNLDTKEKYLKHLSKMYASDKQWLIRIKKLI